MTDKLLNELTKPTEAAQEVERMVKALKSKQMTIETDYNSDFIIVTLTAEHGTVFAFNYDIDTAEPSFIFIDSHEIDTAVAKDLVLYHDGLKDDLIGWQGYLYVFAEEVLQEIKKDNGKEPNYNVGYWQG